MSASIACGKIVGDIFFQFQILSLAYELHLRDSEVVSPHWCS